MDFFEISFETKKEPWIQRKNTTKVVLKKNIILSKKTKKTEHVLPLDTKIQVVAIKGEKAVPTTMTFSEALQIKKKPGWIYNFYQIGFSSY